ncbi:MAG: tRNA pseudouridine(38-40) synthase TruA [Deltaproteobacteria bacterium]|nr:tRNA pseudouridine(38-40) synthase TruA [Deltaproteobacteria bacterium]
MADENIRLTLFYDGTRYHGWQRQKNAVTLQATIEDKLELMLETPVTLIASGRTDAGVHALGQVCHFLTSSTLDPEVIKRGLNALLPDDVFIARAEYVPLDFHARYDVRRKTYEYRIWNRREPDLFRRAFLWHVPVPLSVDRMSRGLTLLEGTHDFSSFRSSGSGNQDPVRTLFSADIHGASGGDVSFIFEGNGFLRHMVRNMVGTLVQVGLNKMDMDTFASILPAKDRRKAGMKAPAKGLFLVRVVY